MRQDIGTSMEKAMLNCRGTLEPGEFSQPTACETPQLSAGVSQGEKAPAHTALLMDTPSFWDSALSSRKARDRTLYHEFTALLSLPRARLCAEGSPSVVRIPLAEGD